MKVTYNCEALFYMYISVFHIIVVCPANKQTHTYARTHKCIHAHIHTYAAYYYQYPKGIDIQRATMPARTHTYLCSILLSISKGHRYTEGDYARTHKCIHAHIHTYAAYYYRYPKGIDIQRATMPARTNAYTHTYILMQHITIDIQRVSIYRGRLLVVSPI